MGCYLIGIIVFIFSTRLPRSKVLFRALVKLVFFLYRQKGLKLDFDPIRFEKSSWILPKREKKAGNLEKSIELVVVSTSKDFDILPHSVDHALKALSKYKYGGVRIIVPKSDVMQCKKLFRNSRSQISIIDENTFISKNQFEILSNSFGDRDTWVLQQLLKVQAVISSKADAVLILDSDTILLRKRPWFDQEANQILTPSTEFNPAYYLFLNQMISTPVIPNYTYVSHHMLMQPNVFKQILKSLDLLRVESLINYCCINSDKTVQSPICIEYELYAQFLSIKKYQIAFHALWSNVTIPKTYSRIILNSKLLRFLLSRLYNSISFHSWS